MSGGDSGGELWVVDLMGFGLFVLVFVGFMAWIYLGPDGGRR